MLGSGERFRLAACSALQVGFVWCGCGLGASAAAEGANVPGDVAQIRSIEHRQPGTPGEGINVRYDGSGNGIEIIREGEDLVVRFAAATISDALLGATEVDNPESAVARYEVMRAGPIVNLVVSQRDGVRKAEAYQARRQVVLGFQSDFEPSSRRGLKVANRIGPLALATSPQAVSRQDLERRAQRVLDDESCYGGEAWRPKPAGSTDPEAQRIRGLRSWESFRDCPACPEMKVIPAGEFEMGTAPRGDGRKSDEEPLHHVAIRSFAVAKYELEWSSFERFVKATQRTSGDSCRALSEGNGNWDVWTGLTWEIPGYVQEPNHPAVCVSWEDAQDYVRWLSAQTGKRYRLLSEAEWEYAARANVVGQVYWTDRGSNNACVYGNVADQTSSDEFNWVERFSCSDRWWLPAPVGNYRPNAFGLYDMLGNVWEWVEDCANPDYELASADGRPRTCGQCERRMMRGASWGTRPSGVRFGNRARAPIDRRSVTIGFRVARDLE